MTESAVSFEVARRIRNQMISKVDPVREYGIPKCHDLPFLWYQARKNWNDYEKEKESNSAYQPDLVDWVDQQLVTHTKILEDLVWPTKDSDKDTLWNKEPTWPEHESQSENLVGEFDLAYESALYREAFTADRRAYLYQEEVMLSDEKYKQLLSQETKNFRRLDSYLSITYPLVNRKNLGQEL